MLKTIITYLSAITCCCSSGDGSLWSIWSSDIGLGSLGILDEQSGATVISPRTSSDVHGRRLVIAAGFKV